MCLINRTSIDTDKNNICYIVDSILSEDFSIWDQHPGFYKGSMGWVNLIEFQDIDNLYREWDSFISLLPKYTDIVFVGFGGSILGGKLLNSFMSSQSDITTWYVDTVNPEELETVNSSINLSSTLFMIASKSGNTLETRCLERFFYEFRHSSISHLSDGKNFFAITDQGSDLEHLANMMRYEKVVYGDRKVGGRFSALTPFGLFPAYLMGARLTSFDLIFGGLSEKDNRNSRLYDEIVSLIQFIAKSLESGRDKLTIEVPSGSPSLDALALWIEQLISESLGKDGNGIILITKEPQMNDEDYSSDRAFIFIETGREQIVDGRQRILDLARANFPVMHMYIDEVENNIVSEIFKWQIAVAALGHLLKINPFDQPEVERSKMLTRTLLSGTTSVINRPKGSGLPISQLLDECRFGNYIGILAYLPRISGVEMLLAQIRRELTRITGVPTTLGYAPSYLHSTGQLHKGGPRNGVFIQITYDLDGDFKIPGEDFTFGDISMAQSEGDFIAMMEQNIPITKYHLGKGKINGLKTLLKDLKQRNFSNS